VERRSGCGEDMMGWGIDNPGFQRRLLMLKVVVVTTKVGWTYWTDTLRRGIIRFRVVSGSAGETVAAYSPGLCNPGILSREK
jgi:hypothetical protein